MFKNRHQYQQKEKKTRSCSRRYCCRLHVGWKPAESRLAVVSHNLPQRYRHTFVKSQYGGRPRRTKKLPGTRKVPGPWTTTWSKQYLSAVHPLTCSLLWVRCLFDPLIVWVFGPNDPWMKTFPKFISKICVSTMIHVSWQIWRKSTVAKLPKSLFGNLKSYLVLLTKKTGVGDTFEPSISPPLSQSRPKFRERCWPLTCACVPTSDRLRFAGLILERVQKSENNIGFQRTEKLHINISKPPDNPITWQRTLVHK